MSQPLQAEIRPQDGALQCIRFTLEKGQVLIGESGSMMFMDDGISFECRLGDGSLFQDQQNSSGGWFGMMKTAFRRVMTNESMFFTWFTNQTSTPRVMAVAAPHMGTIVPVNLHELPRSTIIAQGGAFLCSSLGVRLTIELVKKFGTGFFGGEGFLLQRLQAEQNSAGQLWMHGNGLIKELEINNEELTLDAGCLMAFTEGINYEVGLGGWGNALKGGQVFLAKLQGTGKVWVQSMPFNKYADRIIDAIPVESEGDYGDNGGDWGDGGDGGGGD